jgi:hypothetical protein
LWSSIDGGPYGLAPSALKDIGFLPLATAYQPAAVPPKGVKESSAPQAGAKLVGHPRLPHSPRAPSCRCGVLNSGI